jgi:DNA-binding HxlR family transcriptional regulator
MVSEDCKSQVLEGRLAVKILLVLLEETEPIMKGNLLPKVTKGTGTAMARIKELQDAGLVTEEQESQRPFRKIVQLTDKGRQVAEKLAEIEEIMGED